MIKTITRVGNSQGIIFDAALMELARLKVGDEVNISLHDGGALIMTPVRPVPDPEAVERIIQTTMEDYAKTMRNLA